MLNSIYCSVTEQRGCPSKVHELETILLKSVRDLSTGAPCSIPSNEGGYIHSCSCSGEE